MEKKLSIIIPVFNGEKYIDRCLNSLYCQGFSEFEIIIIDDGSTDKSGQICDKWAAEKGNIQVFHIENHGVSYARNFGIDKARTEFITFVDIDDYVSSNYFATIFDMMQKHDVDMYVFNLYREEKKDNFVAKKIPLGNGEQTDVEILRFYSLAFYSFVNASYTKIYKTNLLKDNKIYYNQQIKLCEDNIFALDYFDVIKNFYICDAPLYYYALNQGSATQKRKLQYFADDEYLYNKYLSIIKKSKRKLLTLDRLNNTYLRRAFYNIDNLLKQKIPTKEIRAHLNKTEMCQKLIKYKYTSFNNKLLRRKLKYFSKNHMILFRITNFEYRAYSVLKKIMDVLKRK